jgi:hypothetical protein
VCFDLLRTWNFGFVHQVLTYSRRDNESIFSRIQTFDFWHLSRLAKLVEYGRDYLSEEEYDYCRRDAERTYFLFLGEAALQGRDQKFWEFHRKGLASIKYPLDWRLLGKWIPIAMLENPKRACKFLWARRGRAIAAFSRHLGDERRELSKKRFFAKP